MIHTHLSVQTDNFPGIPRLPPPFCFRCFRLHHAVPSRFRARVPCRARSTGLDHTGHRKPAPSKRTCLTSTSAHAKLNHELGPSAKYMCIYIYMRVCVCVCAYTYTYIYICVCVYLRVYIYIYIYDIYIYICIYIYIYVHPGITNPSWAWPVHGSTSDYLGSCVIFFAVKGLIL